MHLDTHTFIITSVSNKDGIIPKLPDEKNMDIRAIIVGNLPLQGTRVFVMIAISLSLGESIILHPVTPTALHPNPMHMKKLPDRGKKTSCLHKINRGGFICAANLKTG